MLPRMGAASALDGKIFASMLWVMKRPISLTSPLGITWVSAIAVALLFLVTGCKLLDGPPKAWEQRYYDITTNTIEMVNWSTNVVTKTNYQTVIVEKEVPGKEAIIMVTNVVPVLTHMTNVVTVTNVVEDYTFKPNQRAKDEIIGKATDIGGYGGPVVGQIAGGVTTLLVGLWGVLRSRKHKKNESVLAHSIQVGRELLKDNPAVEAAYKEWLMRYQSKTGTFTEVAKIKGSVDSKEAADIAKTIAPKK